MGLWSVLIIPMRLLAISFHEFAHSWASSKLGDPTPRIHGRLTINPLAHLDLMGTILMLLTGFGWAKPVEINPMYYKDRKKGTALVAAAGPLSNFILAFFGVLLQIILTLIFGRLGMQRTASFFYTLFSYFVQINLCFMVFNLIPIPPLDGSRIITMFVSDKTYYTLQQYERYSMLLIMLLSLSGVFSGVIGTGVSLVYTALWRILSTVFAVFI